MRQKRSIIATVVLVGIAAVCLLFRGGEALGVNWGTMASHQLPPKTVVQMLKGNNIQKVKLFDADGSTMGAIAGSGMEVMVAIPNDQLKAMGSFSRAKDWVRRNVTSYNFNGGVNVKYVAVGNEPFLTSYNGTFINLTYPALVNIQNALNQAGLGDSIKATVPLNADVYNSPPEKPFPSSGRFRQDILDQMSLIVNFLAQNKAPFTVNIYPFLSLYLSSDFPVNYAFFEGQNTVNDPDNGVVYTNVFDANFDTLVASLKALNHGDMPIIVGEVGWPTDGDKNANVANAERFYAGLLPRLAANRGTPMRPGYIEVYLFGLLDEDAKSIAPGSFERHWGIFKYDGQPKFPMDFSGQGLKKFLVGAQNVDYLPARWCMYNPNGNGDISKLGENIDYACRFSDCTALGYGSSCGNLDVNGNASYAFNMYFQVQNQQEEACYFQGLATITSQNLSQGQCNFPVQIGQFSSGHYHRYGSAAGLCLVSVLVFFMRL
ncbi:PREDICTED: glucan endo-1,3-beta-glucosidase 8-like [Tarenaya hassleriana]|uniref:glucan endo-1,3-beta-glucosidase 8-like n=1 Tax=Tarenaya hassleriana TaxID=28532 RepID=UPI00053CA47E|nr:PREDICTED: glucan endo-1,3-beta-glucosidase 8-like [Tarenaya hassleriana]